MSEVPVSTITEMFPPLASSARAIAAAADIFDMLEEEADAASFEFLLIPCLVLRSRFAVEESEDDSDTAMLACKADLLGDEDRGDDDHDHDDDNLVLWLRASASLP
eukprot:CAMPEP_0185270716 /NCGR_PEP_ID=MMETSP1359-20130426/42984_1 /TAXON_ID=552665 /ORGANISM="Bigelowiella longifila, Strain CCMP242" /LENGTH=105 /DNA_ID=CAMNT_0027862395 /DNA_START=819 /DNA_END=1136 /DNA_ORIENTATION=+